jgi:hypothetical protein
MAASIASLPWEVLLAIVELLNSYTDRLSLAFCSRHLHYAILPVIYEDLRVAWKPC